MERKKMKVSREVWFPADAPQAARPFLKGAALAFAVIWGCSKSEPGGTAAPGSASAAAAASSVPAAVAPAPSASAAPVETAQAPTKEAAPSASKTQPASAGSAAAGPKTFACGSK